MKKIYPTCLILFITFMSHAQQWTWMKGSDTLTQPGIYGTMGISSPSNNPGSRHGAATWVDNSGNLWMFGGEGISTNTVLCWLSDMWKYNVSNGEWTWVKGTTLPNQNGIYGTKGVPSATNHPGAREFMVTWTDAAGNFWMFGGDGFPAAGSIGQLNDLWKYNPLTNEWTWMNGTNLIWQNGIYGTKGVSSPMNTPGTRNAAGTWTDASGNFWLFGGYGYPATGPAGNLNDLWKYDVASNEWTWMSGTNIINQYGNYGTIAVTSPTNNPGAREFPACWRDSNNDFWMFGGGGFPAAGSQGHLNDMWKYNLSSGNWTWMGGSNSINQFGNYGTINTSSPTNIPGSRFASAAWTDPAGNLWLFGGTGYTGSVVPGRLNDLFRYNTANNEWTWEHGAASNNSNGIYGVITVPAPFTTPGARYYNTWWKKNNGQLWLFGSLGFCATGNSPNNMNDLWKFTPSCEPVNMTIPAMLSICSGNSATLSAASPLNPAINWFSSSTSTLSLGSGTTFITPVLTASVSAVSYTYYAKANACPNRTPVSITVNTTPTVNISTDNPLVCIGTTLNLTASGATTYSWSTAATGSVIVISPSVTTTYTVTGYDSNGCSQTTQLTQSVSLCTGISGITDSENLVAVVPNPNSGQFILQSEMEGSSFYLVDCFGRIIFQQELMSKETGINLQLSGGIYYYYFKNKEQLMKKGKIIIE